MSKKYINSMFTDGYCRPKLRHLYFVSSSINQSLPLAAITSAAAAAARSSVRSGVPGMPCGEVSM